MATVTGYVNQAALDNARATHDPRLNAGNARVISSEARGNTSFERQTPTAPTSALPAGYVSTGSDYGSGSILENPAKATPTGPTAPVTTPPSAQTAQPSPSAIAPATPINQPKATVAGQQTSSVLPGANDIAAQYKQAAVQGAPPGTDIANAGSAKTAVQTSIQNQPASAPAGGMNLVQTLDSGENKDFAQIQKAFTDFYSPKNQGASLLDTYHSLMKQSGLPELNSQLINYKKIINGTEDDIRTEITKAGGFATDSQVMGMTNARNKSLIANYNTLLETKNSITENINSMMQYAQADRQYATQQFESRMNFEFKKMEYGQQAQTFAANQLQKIVDVAGYGGLYQMTNGDTHAISRVEQALGLGDGGLESLATMPVVNDKNLPEIAKEYQYAQSQGYTGSFEQYQNQDANRKRPVTNINTGDKIETAVQTQDALDAQTVNSSYKALTGIIGDPSKFTEEEAAKLSDAQVESLGKAIGRMQNPDIARQGGDAGNIFEPNSFTEKIAQQYRSAIKGQKYLPNKIVEAVRAAGQLQTSRGESVYTTGNVPANSTTPVDPAQQPIGSQFNYNGHQVKKLGDNNYQIIQ